MRVPSRFVGDLRVPTDGQGRSGLGLKAQRRAVAVQVAQVGGTLLAESQELESGKLVDRPQLAAALAACRTRRSVLLIAKLDRLARNARFLLSVLESSGEAGVMFCNLPTVPAGPVGKFPVTQMAAVAELEAGLISQRTRTTLAVAKTRGVKLGNLRLAPEMPALATTAREPRSRQVTERTANVIAVLRQAQDEGVDSLCAIAAGLQIHGILAPAGKVEWSATQVQRLLISAPTANTGLHRLEQGQPCQSIRLQAVS